MDSWGKSKTHDPIGDYLKTDIAPCDDPIGYWSSLLGRHPLAQMALDFLSAPAASVEVERAFSKGGLTVSKRRHGLSDDSIRAATILSSWSSIEGIVPEAEVIERLKNKGKRTRASQVENVYDDVQSDADDDIMLVD